MAEDKIIDRIAKLLELADPTRGGTKAERELATQRAHEMMLKYNIEQSEVSGRSAKSDVNESTEEIRGATSEWKKDLIILLGEVLFVKGFYSKRSKFTWKVTLIGRPENIAFVQTLCKYLIPQLEAEALASFKEASQWEEIKPRSFRRAFYQSATYVIRARLEDQREKQAGEPGTDLIRNEDAANLRYMAEQGIKLGQGRSRSYSSTAGHYTGQAAGGRVNLNPGKDLK